MNSSLSTVDSLFNTNINLNPNPTSNGSTSNQRLGRNLSLNQPSSGEMQSSLSGHAVSLQNGMDQQQQLDKARSSPSFNDSEPPSYFEAIGISHHNQILLNTDGNPQYIPKLNTNSSINSNNYTSINYKDISNNQSSPPSFNCSMIQHGHQIRTANIPLIYQQSPYPLNESIISNNRFNIQNNQSNNNSTVQKPSETYIVWSIFTTIYCIFIGIAALVLSIKVYHYNKQGNYQKAYAKSKIARNLNIAGLFFGIIYMGIGIIATLLPRGWL